MHYSWTCLSADISRHVFGAIRRVDWRLLGAAGASRLWGCIIAVSHRWIHTSLKVRNPNPSPARDQHPGLT